MTRLHYEVSGFLILPSISHLHLQTSRDLPTNCVQAIVAADRSRHSPSTVYIGIMNTCRATTVSRTQA